MVWENCIKIEDEKPASKYYFEREENIQFVMNKTASKLHKLFYLSKKDESEGNNETFFTHN